MVLRPAMLADLETIEQIVLDAYSPYIALIGRAPVPMSHDYRHRIAHSLITVAENATILGLIVEIRHADHLFIENVAVAPCAQGQGIGRRLLAHAEEHARAAGLRELRLHTHRRMTNNRKLYRRLGYVELPQGTDPVLERIDLIKTV